MTKNVALTWIRNDLRLHDNPALYEAQKADRSYAVYIWQPESEEPWAIGGASRWWLHHSLKRFAKSVQAQGGELILACGEPLSVLETLIEQLQVTQVYWNRRYEAHLRDTDAVIKKKLRDLGLTVESKEGNQLLEPWLLKNKSGEPYKVFTPFMRAFLKVDFTTKPLPKVQKISKLPDRVNTLNVDQLGLLPTIPWYHGMEKEWQPGEEHAIRVLKEFIKESRVGNYQNDRDFPAISGTSKLSPYLRFGEISPRLIWNTMDQEKRFDKAESSSFPYLRQLIWREFATYSLFHFPTLPVEPIKAEFKKFPWSKNAKLMKAWQTGQTGYPIIDAGMRELWSTGWMHNRVRMIVGSFLVKNLHIDWLEGERWFWDTLVDADLANNSMGWQWVAGCGIDAAPFFRIFNPILQSEKFDPEGQYIRNWVPELRDLPKQWIHQPIGAPHAVLKTAGIELGKTYPRPIVDYKKTRQQALEFYQLIQGKI